MSADFTGVTCLMGASAVPRPVRGICFPSSSTTKSHACYYPSGDNETVFQLYFPAKTIGEDWGPQSAEAWKKQQAELVGKLRSDGCVRTLLLVWRCNALHCIGSLFTLGSPT